MTFRLGSLNHAKGFVINKLYEQHRFGAKHLAVEDLVTGYKPQWLGLLKQAIDELQTEGIILIQKKRTRGGYGDHATLVWGRLDGARGLLNGFRKSASLPTLGKDLKTLLPVKK